MIDLETVFDLLSKTYWAADRTKETIEKSIGNSIFLVCIIMKDKPDFEWCRVSDYFRKKSSSFRQSKNNWSGSRNETSKENTIQLLMI